MSIIIYSLFTISGFIALIYEATWSRYLKLFLGHSSYGQILTLCIFMGGLGLGAFIAGRLAKRLRNPLYCYAILELLIGLGGLSYHKAYLLTTNLFYSLTSSFSPTPFISDVLKIALSTLFTGPLAILIGMTFPILAIGLMRIVQDRGKTTLSILYFTNSLGAAIGIMVTSYALIPSFGTIGSLIIAGSGNLIIAICFLFISKKAQGEIALDSFTTESDIIFLRADSYPQYIIVLWVSISFLTGLSSFIYEIGWLRLINMLLGSTTHSFDIMVSSFILGLAFGGFFARNLLRRSKYIGNTLALVQILMGTFAIVSIYLTNPFFELVRYSNLVLIRSEVSYYVYSTFKYVLCLFLMFPTSFFAGMTLPIITYYLINVTRNERYTGSVYGWNTIGAISGAALGGLIVLPILQLKLTVATGAFIDIAIGLLLLGIYKTSNIRYALAIGLSLLVIIPVFFVHFESFLLTSGGFRAYVTNPPIEKVYVRDGKTATISLHETGNHISIKSNGRTEASISLTDKPSGGEFDQATPAFIGMSMLNKPYDAAMIGLGSGMTAHHLLGDPLLKQLDLVEIEEEFYNLAKGFLPHNKRVYTDKRINFVFEDARTFFHRQKKKYDLIISQPSVIWVSGVSSLFTEEFYNNVNLVLKPGGVLIQWLQLFELNPNMLSMILKTISNVFPYAKIYINKGTPSVVIAASKENISPIHYKRFEESEEITEDVKRFSDKINFFTNASYVISAGNLKQLLDNFNPNSDFFPIVEYGAEKALFLRQRATLIPFVNSLFYYQEVLEPHLFSNTLNEKLLKQAEYKPDPTKMEYLLTLLRQANSGSDWEGIESLLDELIPIEVLRGQWNRLEAVRILREHVLRDTLPETLKLKFLFLDYSINNNIKPLNKIIEKFVSRFSDGQISTDLVRGLAIQSYKMNNYELFEAVNNKFVKQNKEISRDEKMLLYYMGNRLKDSQYNTSNSSKNVKLK